MSDRLPSLQFLLFYDRVKISKQYNQNFMFQEAHIKMPLTIDQIAKILKQLSSQQVAVLEELLDKNTTKEVIKRSKDSKKSFVSHEEMLQLFS